MRPSPSHFTDSGVGATRRRSLEEENAGPLSRHSTNLNEDSVISTEGVKPNLSNLSSCAQLPKPNDSDKRRLNRRSVTDDDEDSEVKGRPDATKLKSLRKRKVLPVSTLEALEESSSKDEKPIRYFGFLVFHSIISFLLYLFIFAFNLVKENESP